MSTPLEFLGKAIDDALGDAVKAKVIDRDELTIEVAAADLTAVG